MMRLMVSVGQEPVGRRCPNCHVNLPELTRMVYRDAIFELSYFQMSFLCLVATIGGYFMVHSIGAQFLPRWADRVVSGVGAVMWGAILFSFVWMMRQLSKPSKLFFRMAERRQRRELAAARAAEAHRRRSVAALEAELRPPE